MSHTPIVLNLPDELLQRYRHAATQGNRTIEEVMMETLTSHQPEVEDYDRLLAPLVDYSDEQLWQLVHETLTEAEKSRYELLVDKRRGGAILEQEQAEIDALAEKIEMQMLFRSEALALLKERGFDTQAYLNGLEV
jgi:hypothetical protein